MHFRGCFSQTRTAHHVVPPYYAHCNIAASSCQHLLGFLGHFTLDQVQLIDRSFLSPAEVPWMERGPHLTGQPIRLTQRALRVPFHQMNSQDSCPFRSSLRELWDDSGLVNVSHQFYLYTLQY